MFIKSLKAILFELLPNKWILRSGTNKNQVIYLTFDDSPHERIYSITFKIA